MAYVVPYSQTLFELAAARLGDPLAWWQLAQASGLSDPLVQGGSVVTIPPSSTDSNEGLPPT